jgi:pimeloyl-ACP methyl ester carboxylesterase
MCLVPNELPARNRLAAIKPPVPRTILTALAIAALIYIALCLMLFLAQRTFIYYPQPKSAANNSTTLTLTADDAQILVSMRPHRGPDAVIYFGGNAEDVSRSLPKLVEAFPERAVFALNYRGYGGSAGRPSEFALISDALLLFDRVHIEHAHIVVIGRSLGSGVAVRVASERPVERLVLVTPYDSLLNIAAGQFRFFPIRWLLLDKFESWRYAPKVAAPIRLIAAQHDEVIPFASTKSLYAHMPQSRATLTVIPGVGHNDISESPEYIPALRGNRLDAAP